MKEKIVLIASIVVGLIAFALTHHYLKSERDKLYAGAEKIQILAAARDLPAGTILKMSDLGHRSEFKTAVGENVFRWEDMQDVLDKRLIFPLKAREPLWWSHVELPRGVKEGLAPMIKSGMRALSIAIGGDAAVSGLVKPNDRVDVLGTFSFPSKTTPGEMETITLTVLQDVTVLATGQELAKETVGTRYRSSGRRGGGYSTVTFEVTLREAELLVFAQNVKGRLTLALRNPDDLHFEPEAPEIDFLHLQRKLPELNLYRQLNVRGKTEKDVPELRALRKRVTEGP